MNNLLFISNNPQIKLLKAYFQQILKMRIEVVGDFDQGLKDVFEKRPAVVCIQDQIGGVSGESVARHIQLLLGKDASHFILMHEGNPKARIVSGLFDHLVDLTVPFEKVCESLSKALKIVLGSHWDAIYTALPVVKQSVFQEVDSGISPADQLIEDFITESSIFNPQNVMPLPGQEVEPVAEPESVFEHDLPGGPPAEPAAAMITLPKPLVAPDPLVLPVQMDPLVAGKKPPASLMQPLLDPPVRPTVQKPPVAVVTEESAISDETSVPVEELLQAFEENYKSRKRMIRLVIIVILVLLVFGLVLIVLKQRTGVSHSPVAVVKQQLPVRPEQPEQTQVVQTLVSSVKPSNRVTQTTASMPDLIPSFIPKSGHDAGFSNKKPGWSRYLSERRDYRLFHADGKLMALQVLVIGDSTITPSELKLALRELTGNEQFPAGHQEHKGELWLEHALASGHAELLIYRSRKNGPIKAFVIAPIP
jgi:hypothetical protein